MKLASWAIRHSCGRRVVAGGPTSGSQCSSTSSWTHSPRCGSRRPERRARRPGAQEASAAKWRRRRPATPGRGGRTAARSPPGRPGRAARRPRRRRRVRRWPAPPGRSGRTSGGAGVHEHVERRERPRQPSSPSMPVKAAPGSRSWSRRAPARRRSSQVDARDLRERHQAPDLPLSSEAADVARRRRPCRRTTRRQRPVTPPTSRRLESAAPPHVQFGYAERLKRAYDVRNGAQRQRRNTSRSGADPACPRVGHAQNTVLTDEAADVGWLTATVGSAPPQAPPAARPLRGRISKARCTTCGRNHASAATTAASSSPDQERPVDWAGPATAPTPPAPRRRARGRGQARSPRGSVARGASQVGPRRPAPVLIAPFRPGRERLGDDHHAHGPTVDPGV